MALVTVRAMPSIPAPLLFPLQGARRRVLYVSLYEGLAIAIVTLTLLAFTREGLGSASGLAVGCSAIAVAWNLAFNALFEHWERRQPVRGRSTARRVAHAIGFEGGLVLWLVPFIAWWLQVSLWQALLMDLGLLLFFLVYTFAFTWVFDRLFGLPAAAA
ncbi:MAG: PACE efflux transporter [Comamonadaceae bacterium]|nr:PACE efflux transporter [Comamonadaceae bacterium]